MMKSNILFLFIIFFASCKEQVKQDTTPISVAENIQSLNSNEAKKAWLEDIFKADQQHRGDNSNSDAYMKKDPENLKKIEQYLSIHGYPDIKELGETAAVAPWIVIHHAGLLESRTRNFSVLHQAYKDGNIKGSAFYLYLFRTYYIKNRKKFKMDKSPFTSEEEIEALILALGLSEK